jgi:hypothetical protein
MVPMADVLAISPTWSKLMTPLQSPLPAALSGNLPVFFDQLSAAPGPSIAADMPESLRQTVILEPKAYARICLTQRRESLPDAWVRNASDSDWSRRVNLLPQADLLQTKTISLALIYAANGGPELHDAIVELQVQAAHKRGMARTLRQLLPPQPDSDAGRDTGTAAVPERNRLRWMYSRG